MRIALATCVLKPEPDPDEELLALALARAGADVVVRGWDDPDAHWDHLDLCVLRSTWNYPHHAAAFLEWAARVDALTTLLNPLALVRDNLHKRYLQALADRGVPVVDTVHLPRGSRVDLPALLAARGWSSAVVKPAVSAASFATTRVAAADAADAQPALDAHLAARDMMIQPYLRSVEDHGERALVWIDGALTHAVRKQPRFAEQHEEVSDAVDILPDERRVAEAALAPLARDLLYARVDLARDDAGAPRVMELELIEPSLFLAQHPPALARFVAAITARVERSGSAEYT